ncbi:nuclear pore complex protein Nup107 [Sitophilus oryzae]|uniref:Nuclear pore complex protein n=1 Tax=Sitophilus oryzae TaxID=7048 RepID=A0A6J2XFJ4_SITOR|nr:nuclear pore complex protein Nup107 [Sitophilus oryzae]
MDNDLNRSVRLLEDALSTPSRGLFKKSLSQHFNESKDLTLMLAPHELQKLKSDHYLYNETMADLLHGDTTLTGSVIQNEAPWKGTVDNLYMEFFEALQGDSASKDVLEILAELARCCSDTLKVVRSLHSKVALSSIDEENWLEKERDTWKLLYILYQDRFMAQNLVDEDMPIQYFGKSEKNCMESLFKRESLVRECQLVIDWLESQTCEKDDKVLHFSDSTVGWENTLHQLQSSDTIAFGSSRQIVYKLDPDAPHYQKKPLHDLDNDDEQRLNRHLFEQIRYGKLEEAEKLARQCGHGWKAAILEGWRLFHNPNIKEETDNEVDDGYEEMELNELKDIEGNSNRDAWKIMAIRYCKQDWISKYEKASIGVFCGYINSILPVCNTWEDFLWAYMKCMVDIRVESEIRDCCTKDNGYLPLPDEYWIQRTSLNDVFTTLESSKNKTVREQAKERERIIQKYIILDEIPALLRDLEEWVEGTNVSTQFLRFAAHLVLFLDQIGQGHKQVGIEKVIEAYIKRLMQMKETQLIAFYVNKLSPSKQVHMYAQYLENIIDYEERKISLEYADECGLDVMSVARQVVENIRKRPEEVDKSGNLQQKITETDKFKISAIDWLIFYESQRIEALAQTNAIIFNFLTVGKLDAAQLAFNKIPSDSVKTIQSEISESNEELNLIVKEYLSYKAYLEAYETFNEWFKQIKNKPSEPEKLPETAHFPEKVAHEHRVSQFKAELERWKLTTNHLAKSAKGHLYNVLLFPDGWLSGTKDAESLRKVILPEVTLLLYSVLSETKLYQECVQLADILATEAHGLYKEFTKDQLGSFLIKIGESAALLTEMDKDPFGNEITA